METAAIMRMKELVQKLDRAAKAYYQQDTEIISNREYDQMYDELQALEKETGTVLANSPTISVGYEAVDQLPKEEHESPMLSLDKTKDREVLREFIGEHKTLLSWKLDGLTIVLTYENGELAKAVTRGNGVTGEVVTNNARVFKNVPLKIPYQGRLVLRGEAIITYSDFERINESIEDVDAKYKNPRNLCSGSVRLMNFKDVEYKGFVKAESEIIELFYFKFQDFPLLSRMDTVADYFIDEVETLRDRDLADDEKELIREKFMKLYVTRDLYVIYSQFLKENGYKGLPRVSYEKRKLKYEDVYPVLYLKYRLQSQQGRSNIKHLVVDEMQDYSRLQYEILQRIFSCRMTILGDRAQTMDDKQQDVLKFLPKIFGRDIHKIIMNKSYRNTIEIASYANQLAGIEDMELFERHGAPVEEKIFANMSHAAEEIAETLKLGEEEYETAAVVLRTEKEAEHMWLLLKEILGEKGFDIKERLSYLDRNSTSFKKGLTVTTFYLAKGLEFDQVFAVFPQKDQSPLVRQARYIAATRALHELHMYEVEK